MIDWSARHQPGTALQVNVATLPALLADLRRHFQSGRGFALATLNLDHLVKLRSNPAFASAYRAHSHVTADGNPVVWLSRLAGRRVDLIPGSDLVGPVTRLAAETETPVALFGATEQALAAAATALCRDAPGLRIVARIAPPMGFDPAGPAADAAIRDIGASGAGLCLLALGAPKQEIFAAHAAARLPQTGFMSIGAGLDFLAGTQARAPRWVRRIAAEWLWRLASSPRRLAGRYARCFAILPGQALDALRARRG
ncbi:WecB/TagA/CpsF family glycosyltransferase [Paracoccus beibuensis]|uniref:WecB/TagA/CpsF family glycosyltransferase n=1 Tax=Paracoccus beibuensis TaxID=547602 RepID=UPI00223F6399|nr:WecB/TagA/CpsF family glycosyltransferase [Paracoccus beibuensis]